MMQSILAGLSSEQIVYQPYPYVYVPEALDAAYYAELANAYPGMERIAGKGPWANNSAYLLGTRRVLADPALPAVWRDFFAYHCSAEFLQAMLVFWRDAIAREYPAIEAWFGKPLSQLTTAVRHRSKEKIPENLSADVMLDCQFGINSPVNAPTSVRGPHVDKPYKLFAALLYFRHPDDKSTGGDLILYRFRTHRYHFDGRLNLAERFVEPFAKIPYRPNTLVMWLNTSRSLHGISPRSTTPLPRRYVNFLAESYALQTDGFFPIKRQLTGRSFDAAKRFVGFRDV